MSTTTNVDMIFQRTFASAFCFANLRFARTCFVMMIPLPPTSTANFGGEQIYDMMDNVKDHLYDVDETAEEEDNINVAIVGRPNVGK